MSRRVEGARVLVTGAGRGIGAEIAYMFAQEGATVACAARTVSELEAVAALCEGDAFAVRLDVADSADVNRAVAEATERLGGIDVLVNNAGVAGSRKFVRLELDEWRRIMAVDLDGPYLMTRAVLPGMLERGHGRVITIASIYGRIGKPFIAAYAAAKHGVVGLTRALAAEYATSGVTFNCVCPGFVSTPLTDAAIDDLEARVGSREGAEQLLHTPQGRLIEPREVASMCLLLASEDGRSINGQAILVDGGEVQR